MRGGLARHNAIAVAILDADAGIEITYGQLFDRVTQTAEFLRRELGRSLVFQLATNTPDSIILYFACLEASCPVCLLDPRAADRLESLLQLYQPGAVLLPKDVELPDGTSEVAQLSANTYRLAQYHTGTGRRPLHPDLALLLTTSGSTGSPKLVRLTNENVLANAKAIAQYLGIQPGDRSVQSLPMNYSYGLSLINSYLVTGGTVVLTRHSFMMPQFWKVFDEAGCTSFAGVPYMYETLERLRFNPGRHPSLNTMTQAGGGLRVDLIRNFYELATAARCRFFVMYGQTEATARIAYVPHERLGVKIGSIGIPIPGGHLSLKEQEDSDARELIYHGPNVMMGYADSAEDLSAGDQLHGTLATGDLATADSEGFFYLTGRLKRFAKLFGYRISLDEVEKDLEKRYPIDAAVIEREGRLQIYAAAHEKVDLSGICIHLARELNVPLQRISVDIIAAIPLTSSGKKDYKALPV